MTSLFLNPRTPYVVLLEHWESCALQMLNAESEDCIKMLVKKSTFNEMRETVRWFRKLVTDELNRVNGR